MGLTFIAIVLLAGAWAAILLPDIRSRSAAPRRNNSVKSFNQQLSGLDRTRPQGAHRSGMASRTPPPRRGTTTGTPRPVGAPRPRTGAPMPAGRVRSIGTPAAPMMMPRSRAEAARRRRLTVSVLVSLALITLFAGLLFSRTLLFGHLVVDALLAGFVYLSWDRSNRAAARRSLLVPLREQRSDTGSEAAHDDIASVSPITRRASGD